MYFIFSNINSIISDNNYKNMSKKCIGICIPKDMPKDNSVFVYPFYWCFETIVKMVVDNNCIQMDFLKKLLEKDESLVYSLTDFRPIDLGTLLEKTPFDISELITILHSLEEKGFITEVFPNHYVRDI